MGVEEKAAYHFPFGGEPRYGKDITDLMEVVNFRERTLLLEVGAFGGTGGGVAFTRVWDVATDSSDNLYVLATAAGSGDRKVYKYNASGAYQATYTLDADAERLAVDSSGNMWITKSSFTSAFTYNPYIGKKYDSSGSLLLNFGAYLGPYDTVSTFVKKHQPGIEDYLQYGQLTATGAWLRGSVAHYSDSFGGNPINRSDVISTTPDLEIDASDRVLIFHEQGVSRYTNAGVFDQVLIASGIVTAEMLTDLGVPTDTVRSEVGDVIHGCVTSSGDLFLIEQKKIASVNGGVFRNEFWITEYNSSFVYQDQYGGPADFNDDGSGDGTILQSARSQIVEAGGFLSVVDGVTALNYAGGRRVQQFTTAGVWARTLGTAGSDAGALDAVQAMAMDSSANLYTGEQLDEAPSGTTRARVQRWDSDLDYDFTNQGFGFGGTALQSPTGIAITSADDVWVVDRDGNRIAKYDTAGVFDSEFGSFGSGNGQLDGAYQIAIRASNGYLYVADTGNDRIQYFNSAGVYQGKWGSTGSGNGQFSGPRGVAVDESGNVYVADTGNARIQKFSATGTYVSQFNSKGTKGTGVLQTPESLWWDTNVDRLLVCDIGSLGRVEVYNASGDYQGQLPLTARSIAVNGDGLAVWTYRDNNRVGLGTIDYTPADASFFIYNFEADGRLTGGSGTGARGFDTPWGAAIDSVGIYYFADTGNDRIQRYENMPEGPWNVYVNDAPVDVGVMSDYTEDERYNLLLTHGADLSGQLILDLRERMKDLLTGFFVKRTSRDPVDWVDGDTDTNLYYLSIERYRTFWNEYPFGPDGDWEDRYTWARSAQSLTEDNLVTGADGRLYRCVDDHVAAASNQPGGAGAYGHLWRPVEAGTATHTWTIGERYTATHTYDIDMGEIYILNAYGAAQLLEVK
jgi:streptogramin lyase